LSQRTGVNIGRQYRRDPALDPIYGYAVTPGQFGNKQFPDKAGSSCDKNSNDQFLLRKYWPGMTALSIEIQFFIILYYYKELRIFTR